jgi:hypothetical protein
MVWLSVADSVFSVEASRPNRDDFTHLTNDDLQVHTGGIPCGDDNAFPHQPFKAG